MVSEDVIHATGNSVGNDNFLKKSPQYNLTPFNGLSIIEVSRSNNLWKEVICPFNGPGNKQRKEADEDCVVHKTSGCGSTRIVNIDDIRHSMKCVERNSYRKEYFKNVWLGLNPEPEKQLRNESAKKP